MSEKGINGLISILRDAENVPKDVWYSLLMLDADERKEVALSARRITEENFGKGVFVRALIEISSYCKNNCRYCGLRAANKNAVRYRLTKEDILEIRKILDENKSPMKIPRQSFAFIFCRCH